MLVAGNALNVLFAAAVMLISSSGPAFARPLASLAHSIGLSTMGLPGAAWATVVARALALIPLTVLLFSRSPISSSHQRVRARFGGEGDPYDPFGGVACKFAVCTPHSGDARHQRDRRPLLHDRI